MIEKRIIKIVLISEAMHKTFEPIIINGIFTLGGVILGSLLTYFPYKWIEKKKSQQRKNNLLRFIEIDIKTLDKVFKKLIELTPISQTLNTINTMLENFKNELQELNNKLQSLSGRVFNHFSQNTVISDYKLKDAIQILETFLCLIDSVRSYFLSLTDEGHLLIDIHSNIFASFDNYISKELGIISYDTAIEVNEFYLYAKVFCDTSKNYTESTKNLEQTLKSLKSKITQLREARTNNDQQNFEQNLQLLSSLSQLLSALFEDFKSQLQLLKKLYDQTEQKRRNVLESLKNEKTKID